MCLEPLGGETFFHWNRGLFCNKDATWPCSVTENP
jgi:hypothetical protein